MAAVTVPGRHNPAIWRFVAEADAATPIVPVHVRDPDVGLRQYGGDNNEDF